MIRTYTSLKMSKTNITKTSCASRKAKLFSDNILSTMQNFNKHKLMFTTIHRNIQWFRLLFFRQ